jgi:hypothetical protein
MINCIMIVDIFEKKNIRFSGKTIGFQKNHSINQKNRPIFDKTNRFSFFKTKFQILNFVLIFDQFYRFLIKLTKPVRILKPGLTHNASIVCGGMWVPHITF